MHGGYYFLNNCAACIKLAAQLWKENSVQSRLDNTHSASVPHFGGMNREVRFPGSVCPQSTEIWARSGETELYCGENPDLSAV